MKVVVIGRQWICDGLYQWTAGQCDYCQYRQSLIGAKQSFNLKSARLWHLGAVQGELGKKHAKSVRRRQN